MTATARTERTCWKTGKVRYAKKKACLREAVHVDENPRPYYCHACQGWHWTRMERSAPGDGSGYLEGRPWVFVAKDKASIRAYSIGPRNEDWLCVECGRVSSIPDTGWRAVRREAVEHLQGHVRFVSIEEAPIR